MTPVQAAFLGAGTTLLCLLAGLLAKYVWRRLAEAYTALQSVDRKLAEVAGMLTNVANELAYLRSLTAPPEAHDLTPEQAAQIVKEARNGPMGLPQFAPYPSPNLERFPRVEPDAKLEDTNMALLQQTDADLMDEERMEGLRDRGVPVDDRADHPGVQAEA